MASGWVRDSQPANQQSDTPYASSELPYTSSVSRPQPEPLPNRSRIPSISSTNGRPRGLSTVSSTSSVRRKPLPSTASPLATRFSTTAERLDSPLSIVKSSSARPLSIDNPTVYENPTPSAILPSLKSLSEGEENQRYTAIEYVELVYLWVKYLVADCKLSSGTQTKTPYQRRLSPVLQIIRKIIQRAPPAQSQ
jgi:hypothetical protein